MYRKGAEGWMKHLDFILLDVLCLQLSFVLACFLRLGKAWPYGDNMYRKIAIVLVIIDLLVAVLFNSMKNVLKRGVYKELAESVKHVALVVFIVTFYLFSVQEGETYSRIVIYLTAIFHVATGYAARLLWKKVLHSWGLKEYARSLLILTVDSRAEEIIHTLGQVSENFRIAGIALLDRALLGEEIQGVPVVATQESVTEYVCREWIDEVFVSAPSEIESLDVLLEQFAEMGVTVHMDLSQFRTLPGQKQLVEKVGAYTVLTSSINVATPMQAFLKRSLDILGGLMGCLATMILFLFIAPAIYCQSPGPVLFKQERIGKNGKRFIMYKFRSMYLDAEERKKELLAKNRISDGMMFKLDWDPRIIGNKVLADGTKRTGIGEFIRRTSLDEFPQFFNVLKGDMSLVGTRPPTVDEWEKYELHHRARLAMKPGITGLWQVSGRSNITDFEEVVKLDKEYICNWSMGMDMRILWKTVGSVANHSGAM